MSSYLEATFRLRAALPGEVTLLIPNIFNPAETLPVHVKQDDLFHVYMSLFGDPDADPQPKEGDTGQMYQNPAVGRPNVNIHTEW